MYDDDHDDDGDNMMYILLLSVGVRQIQIKNGYCGALLLRYCTRVIVTVWV